LGYTGYAGRAPTNRYGRYYLSASETEIQSIDSSEKSVGEFGLSTPAGVGFVDPARLRRAARPAIVHIARVVVDGEPEDASGSAVLVPPGTRRIVIEYQGLSLAAPETVRFRVKLDGFEPQWSSPVGRSDAVYTNLGPGSYRFHVMASNANHIWNVEDSTLSFTVEPTLWQSCWFRSALALALGLAVTGVYRLRMRQVFYTGHPECDRGPDRGDACD
jgi:hypothetical protein